MASMEYQTILIYMNEESFITKLVLLACAF